MTVGDKVIYFKRNENGANAYQKYEAQIVKLIKHQAYIVLSNGEKKRVFIENLQRVK